MTDIQISSLYHSHHARLRTGIARQVGDNTADDACGFAWMQLVTHASHVRNDTAYAWLFKTALNNGRRQHNLANRCRDIPHDTATPGASVHDTAAARMSLQTIRRLDRKHQRVVWLRAAGATIRETARVTGASPSTVDHQLRRARRRLRELGTTA